MLKQGHSCNILNMSQKNVSNRNKKWNNTDELRQYVNQKNEQSKVVKQWKILKQLKQMKAPLALSVLVFHAKWKNTRFSQILF